MANGRALTGGSHRNHTVRPFIDLPIDEILVRFQVQQTVGGHRGYKRSQRAVEHHGIHVQIIIRSILRIGLADRGAKVQAATNAVQAHIRCINCDNFRASNPAPVLVA